MATQPVRVGLDRLLGPFLDRVRGFRVGLVANAASTTGDGRPAWVAFRDAGLEPACLFAAEHGARILHAAGERFGSHHDEVLGLPVRSLYDETRKLDSRSLDGVDLVVYDLPQVGCRFYTYLNTLVELLRLSAGTGLPLMVLDRPNPLRGDVVEGPLPLPGVVNEFAPLRIPVRFGLTMAELARWAASRGGPAPNLSVIPMEGWTRDMWGDDTGLPWSPPSPNMRSLETAVLYPGTCLVEGTTMSEGRGTELPFRWFGAPWLDAAALARRVTRLELPGVVVEALTLTPSSSKHAGASCPGIHLRVTDRSTLRPVAAMVRILAQVRGLHPDAPLWEPSVRDGRPFIDSLTGEPALREAVEVPSSLETVLARFDADARAFAEERRLFFAYGREDDVPRSAAALW